MSFIVNVLLFVAVNRKAIVQSYFVNNRYEQQDRGSYKKERKENILPRHLINQHNPEHNRRVKRHLSYQRANTFL